MSKNGKSEDKERNQIDVRTTNPVNYYDDRFVGDANAQMGSQIVAFEKTNGSTDHLPEGNKTNGLLFCIRKERTGNDGYQLYFQDQGNLWFRRAKLGDNNWKLLTQNMNEYIKKPEAEGQVIRDANNISYSGIFRTRNDTSHLPSGIGSDDRWGILQHYYENINSSKAGLQMWTPISGNYKGILYVRVFGGGITLQQSEWKAINVLDLQNVFTHPTRDANDVRNLETGYYYTSDSTTLHLPAEAKSENGIIKCIKKNNLRFLEYIPTEGPNAGKSFYTVHNGTTRTPPNWNTYNKPGQIQIHEDTKAITVTPLDYEQAEKSDTVVFEIKIPDYLGGQPYPDSGAGFVILQTNIVTTEHHIQEHQRVGLVSQIATSNKSGRMFKRHALKRSESQSWDDWTEWVEIASSEKGFRIPERDSLTDVDHVLYSGVYKTTDASTRLGSLPNVTDKDGFLTHYKFDSNEMQGVGKAVQYWQTFKGTGQGKLFYRYKSDSSTSWSNWVEIGSGGTPTPQPLPQDEIIRLINVEIGKNKPNILAEALSQARSEFNKLIDQRIQQIMNSFKIELKEIFKHFHK